MICDLCHQDKLSNEFPFEPLTEECDHPPLHCLRCVTASVKNNQKCSQCENEVREDNLVYQEYMKTLEFMFPIIKLSNDPQPTISAIRSIRRSGSINVTTLSGDCATLPYDPNQTIFDVKKEIQKQLNTTTDKQCLLFQNKELKITSESSALLKLKDYQILPNTTLTLIILLYAVPEGLDRVIFHLCWDFPPNQSKRKKKFLDSSVFLYSGSNLVDIVDYKKKRSSHCRDGIIHSGNAVMDFDNETAHNKIHASLKSIPDHIDKLVFTLSAFNSVNLSMYPNPTLQFYDAKFPDKMLCSDEMNHVLHCQAVIMCGLRRRDGIWHTISLKSRAAGCAKNYSPLQKKIEKLIRENCI